MIIVSKQERGLFVKEAMVYKSCDDNLNCVYIMVKSEDFYWEGPEHDPEYNRICSNFNLFFVDEDEFYKNEEELKSDVDKIQVKCIDCGTEDEKMILLNAIIDGERCYLCLECILNRDGY